MPIPADLFLSPDLSEEDARTYLRSLGFRDAEGTDRHLQAIAEDVVIREAMGRIAGELLPALLEAPDPDAAVVGLSHYLAARTGRAMFLDYLAEDPRAMHVLACVLGSSPMLSEILIRNPEYFHWLVSQVERSAPEREDLEEELDAMLAVVGEGGEALAALRRWQRRELLRIATRELLRREGVPAATAQLSDLAGVTIDRALAIVLAQMLRAESRRAAPGKVAVIGLGALGRRELSYRGDLELLYLFEAAEQETDRDKYGRPFFERLADGVMMALDDGGEEDCTYRIRATVSSLDAYLGRLSASGGMTERLTLIQGRPVAGDPGLGTRCVERVRPFVFRRRDHRGGTAESLAVGAFTDDENGAGPDGARHVERLAQLFQLAHGAQIPALCRQTGTLAVLEALAAASLLPEPVKRELVQAYVFLRAVEHRLQLVPEDRTGLGCSEDLQKQVAECHSRVAGLCRTLVQQFPRD